ncbi:MAG: DUF1801 domain-containing protein [Ekhidna sp.]
MSPDNINPEVDEFLEKKKHPLTSEIQLVRSIILSADERVEETIKWSSPTFMYKGNIASFFLNAKKMVSLMFHKGALINDDHNLLEGDGKEARTARFYGVNDINEKKGALESVIKEWIRMMDES